MYFPFLLWGQLVVFQLSFRFNEPSHFLQVITKFSCSIPALMDSLRPVPASACTSRSAIRMTRSSSPRSTALRESGLSHPAHQVLTQIYLGHHQSCSYLRRVLNPWGWGFVNHQRVFLRLLCMFF